MKNVVLGYTFLIRETNFVGVRKLEISGFQNFPSPNGMIC